LKNKPWHLPGLSFSDISSIGVWGAMEASMKAQIVADKLTAKGCSFSKGKVS